MTTVPPVLLSSGGGRLHFVEAASALLEIGVDLKLIIGVVPPARGARVIDLLGRFFGKRDVNRRLQLRIGGGAVPRSRLISCTLPEINIHVLYRLADIGLVNRGVTQGWAWRVYGWASGRNLRRGGKIFHVRSGAGQGGALARARHLGYRTIADHSIAHPAFIAEILRPVRTTYTDDGFEDFATPFWSAVEADCREADVLLVNSDFVRQTFVERGFAADRIEVVYWGVRDDFIACKTEYAAGTPLRILFTGSFTLRKGAHVIMQAMAELDRRGLKYELTVVGGAHTGPELQRRFGVAGRVRFLGQLPQDRLSELFRSSDVYVFPSLAEGSARAAMEAWGAGIPVVTTLNTGLPLVHGEDGLIVPAGDGTALAEAVERLAGDPALRQRLGATAAHRVATRYRWSDYAARIAGLYRKLSLP